MNYSEGGFGWDDKIKATLDDKDQVLLLPGDYDFEVKFLEKTEFYGSEKMGACACAKLHLRIIGGGGSDAHLVHRLYLHEKTQGLVCAFLRSIGQRAHDDEYEPDWDDIAGANGKCRLGQRTYQNKQYNEIKAFLDKEENLSGIPKISTPEFTDGEF